MKRTNEVLRELTKFCEDVVRPERQKFTSLFEISVYKHNHNNNCSVPNIDGEYIEESPSDEEMMEELVEEVVEETSDDGTKQIEQQSSQCFEDEYEDDKDQIDIDDNFLVSLPDYIRNNEEVISENSQYVVLKGSNLGSNKKEVKIKKSTLLWFLINPERKLSSDRIQRVRDVKTNVSSSSGVKVRSNRTKKKTVTISETDTEDEESFKSGSSDDQWEEQHDDNDDDLESTNVLTNGDWILVKLPGKKCFKHFIGQILKINKSELTIKFCKKYSDNKFKWPEKEDIAVVNKKDVIKQIPQPNFNFKNNRLLFFTFNVSFAGYNVY
ncbi:uncharacterized protein LOC116179328 isoform X2 [Photinus pyralis]|uniref:uncharacterized protein LOC116160684 isoform X2 n=1 Tax=Photinus pyralis TaxID=7054 RepID=UPI001267287B|nr:uncharacterized protein LOC116160684 isoform X2 [Photinus pyralis]XP_031337089.1 uncharacterized protein LOC116166306 isoform X2 [Photinus pyralis]XP_031354959.1 uncharacterized protein LOC116179328 isoform X2 [Photinus pyralis]